MRTAEIIQSRLRDVGILVKIRTVEWAAFLKEFIDKGRFEAILLGWNTGQDPDQLRHLELQQDQARRAQFHPLQQPGGGPAAGRGAPYL